MTTTKKAISLAILLLISIIGSAGAQDTSERQPNSKVDAVIKMSGISPAVGVNYQINNESKVRAIGFISVNSLGSNENYLLDLSYLRNMDWISAEDIDSYWGANVHFQFEDPIIGPGVLIGAAYSLSNHFAVFGEAGFNVFLYNRANNAEIGMLNSGIGLRVDL